MGNIGRPKIRNVRFRETSSAGEGRRAVLIVNPAAGNGRARKAAGGVARELKAGGWSISVSFSRNLEDAKHLARVAAAHGETVVSLGGDGLAGALAGEVIASGATLAVLPGGRGNDFVRAVGLPNNPVVAARSLLCGKEREIDAGRIDFENHEGRTFIGVAGMGFDSYVQQAIEDVNFDIGRAIYAYGVVKALRSWTDLSFQVSIDGKDRSFRGWLLSVSNSGVYGGGMHIAPNAALDDAKLDVVAVRSMSKMSFLGTFPKVFAGKHLDHAAVSSWTASTVKVSAGRPVPLYADGELAGELPATISLEPKALRLLA